MLNIAFEYEFSVNVNSLPYHHCTYVSILHMKYKVKCVNDSLHFQVLLANFYLEKFSKTRKVRTYNLLILCYLTGFHVPKQLFEKFRKFYNSNTVERRNLSKIFGKFAIFHPLRFYVKSILADLRRSKTAILTILKALNYDFGTFKLVKMSKIPINAKFSAVKRLSKCAVL